MLKMIDTIYYNDELRCFRNGVVERLYYHKYWRIVENTVNTGDGYNEIKINGKNIRRHRLIAYCFLGLDEIVGRLDKTNVIDHIDGDKINNSVANLRITNQTGNAQNRPNAKGYSFDKEKKKYKAQIKINKKSIHLGLYETEEEARQSYLEGKEKYHLW
jgi:hypothetical protein